MATVVLFDEFINNLITGAIDLDSHTFKVALSNSAFTFETFDELADISELGNGNGYTTGGVTLTSVTVAESGAGTGIWIWSAADFSWTASGGSIGPFRYLGIYSDTSTNDKLVGGLDYGSSISITTGNSFLGDIGAGGLIQFQEA